MAVQNDSIIAARPQSTRLAFRRVLIGGLFSLTAVAVGVVTLEAAARVVLDRNGLHYGIEMWKYAKDVKRRSANPLMSHEHAPNRHAKLMGVSVTTGSQGLRDRDYPLTRTDGKYRILVLGDSLTFGWGVEGDRTYPKVLERLLNRDHGDGYEVINAGVGNYNTVQEVTYFKDRGFAYQPDEVVLGFYINDAEPVPSAGAGWLRRNSYLYVFAQTGWDAVQRSLGASQSYVDYYRALYADDNPGWRACRQALEELIALTRRHNIRLRVVLLPELHFPNGTYPFADAHRAVAGIGERHGVKVLDLQHAFKGHDPRTLWVTPGDAHPNAKAQEIIATEIYSAMRQERSSFPRRDTHE